MDFDDVPTGGSLMVFGPDRDLFAILDNFTRFFEHESCGFCTPCRSGTFQLREVSDRLQSGRIHAMDLERIRMLAQVMGSASHCGLGKTAFNPMAQALEKRPELFGQRLTDTASPSFDPEAATAESRRIRKSSPESAHVL